jgi:hypothetical protein
MSSSNSGGSGAFGGVGFFGLLGIAFIVLKLCNVIDWSWWYVTLPLWGPVALFLVIYAVVLFFMAVMGLLDSIGSRRRNRIRW